MNNITSRMVRGLEFMVMLLTLTSCYSAMPIANARKSTEGKTIDNSTAKTYILLYDVSIGTEAIDSFIKENKIEVLYRYSNINGYALRLQNEGQRIALEKAKGVLSLQEDKVMQLQ